MNEKRFSISTLLLSVVITANITYFLTMHIFPNSPDHAVPSHPAIPIQRPVEISDDQLKPVTSSQIDDGQPVYSPNDTELLTDELLMIPRSVETVEEARDIFANELAKLPAISHSPDKEKFVYVLFDPLCGYTHELLKLYDENQSSISFNIKWIPVTVLKETTRSGLGYYFGALAELGMSAEGLDQFKAFASAKTKADLPELFDIGSSQSSVYSVNRATIGLAQLGDEQGTPTFIYRDKNGLLQITSGVPALDVLKDLKPIN